MPTIEQESRKMVVLTLAMVAYGADPMIHTPEGAFKRANDFADYLESHPELVPLEFTE